MEYWLYIDESGKFINPEDEHVVYAGVLFKNEDKIKNFSKLFKEAKNKIKNNSNEQELKGNKIYKGYISNIKNTDKKGNYEELIKKYNLIDEIICVWSCKKNLKTTFGEDNAKLKRNLAIALLLKKAIEKYKISYNSTLRIFLDGIHTKEIQKQDAENLFNYLNQDYSKNSIIKFLRKSKLKIVEVLHLDSKEEACIQAADIVANIFNKYLNKEKHIKRWLTLIQDCDVNIYGCRFPNIKELEKIENIECC